MFDLFKRNSESTTVTRSRTSSRVVTLQHEWTIDHFDLCHLGNAVDTIEGEPCLESARFGQPDAPNIQFRLALYPCGKNDHSKNYLSLYLYSDSEKECPFWFKMSVKTSSKFVIRDRKSVCIFGKNYRIKPWNGWGWARFVHRSWAVMSKVEKRLFCENDSLIVQCKIRYVTDVQTTE